MFYVLIISNRITWLIIVSGNNHGSNSITFVWQRKKFSSQNLSYVFWRRKWVIWVKMSFLSFQLANCNKVRRQSTSFRWMRDGLSEGVLACRLTSYIGHIQYICLACNVVVFSVLLFVKPFLLMVCLKPHKYYWILGGKKALGKLNSIIFYFSLVTTLVWSMNYSNTNIENLIKLGKRMNSDIYISMVRLKKTLSQKSEINEN